MKCLLLVFTAVLGIASASIGHTAVKNVVLVHGAFADGSGWKEISDILQRDGYAVYVVQEPETSLDADVAAARLVLDRAGPCVLVGHSYGGAIITQAGVHDAVKSLVYVAAFELAPGESAAAIEDRFPPLAGKSIVPFGSEYVIIDPAKFPADFAPDVPVKLAEFQALSQVPFSLASFQGKVTVAAWSQKPSYGVVAKDDRIINPDAERFMTSRANSETIELSGSHSLFVHAHSKEVAALIEKAAKAAE
jgi:pimeloyl-ACP methyl ester carboxylesterase